jgi:acetyltransferase
VAADREAGAQIIQKRLADHDEYMMPESEANELLQCYGFPVLKSRVVKEESEVEKAAEEVGFPLAMKIHSPDISHKFDAGGVKLKISSIEEARQAFREILENASNYNEKARLEGVLMEKMARGGVEVILGSTRDARFGPVCMFGLGGTFVEALKDVTFRLAPMWEVSAEIMIRSIKAYKVLQGTRGQPASDISAIKDCILRLSQMVSDHTEIAELDINPLIVYPEGQGCVVADSRVLLKRSD